MNSATSGINNSMDLPLVSVITPSYNQGKFIEQTIQSVLSQDYENVEYLIIDGGSTDDTLRIIKQYEDRLKWISEPDRGQTDAINKGFGKAKGDILCWLNSDDTYEPGAIRRAVEYFLEHPDVKMVYGEGNEIDEKGVLVKRFPATQEYDLWKLIHVWDFILQPTTFFKKEIFREIALPDINLTWCMDWDLWIRIGSRFKVSYVNYVFANSRVYSETKTDSGGLKRLREIVSVMRRYGSRKYPLGYFLYGEDAIETIIRKNFPFFYKIFHSFFHMSRILLMRLLQSYQGIYEDKWLGKKARFMLPPLETAGRIEFDMEFPMMTKKLFPNTLDIRANGRKVMKYQIDGPGRRRIPLRHAFQQRGLVEIEMIFCKTFRSEKDTRKLSGLLHGIHIIP
jgi:glycosyltransferase involved in cell wall biosynthesis